MIEVGVEEPSKVPARHIVDDGDVLGRRGVAWLEVAGPGIRAAIDQSAKALVEGVVADVEAQGVGDQGALVIEVQPRPGLAVIDRARILRLARHHGEAVGERQPHGLQL
ncbi:hypothetical protein D3C81_1862010 [compost metagenome]